MTALRVAVIGSGFGGIGAAVRLGQDGHDVTVLERADTLGGVWRDNGYPGSACDVPSYLYSYSFAPKADWSRKFARQPEILRYLEDVADRFDVRRLIRFGTEVLAARYVEDRAEWELVLPGGELLVADAVVAACGQMTVPAWPAVPGLDTFRGPAFHSARWQHDVDLGGARVAVIGTGASAIQFVPEIAGAAGAVEVFQRSPGYVIAKDDAEYDRPLTPWQLRSRRYGTYWLKEMLSSRFNHWPALFARTERAFSEYLRDQVQDPELRARVEPADRFGCKRILVSNAWYAALTQEHVTLVDEEVVRVTGDGVVTADGAHHRADALVYGTGFRVSEFLAPMRVTGTGGRELSEQWREGAQAYLGITVSGFPNLFLVYGPNTNVGHNSIVFMIECQLAYVRKALGLLARDDVASLELRPDVYAAHGRQMQERSARTVFARGGCTSYYKRANGRHTQNWPGSTVAYWLRTHRFRPGDYVVRRSAPVPELSPRG